MTLNIHHAANHVPTKCIIAWCEKGSPNRILDRKHRQSAHSRDQGQTRASEKKIPEPCNTCGKELKSASGMRYHKLNHKETVELQGEDLLQIKGEQAKGDQVPTIAIGQADVQYITLEEAEAADLEVTQLIQVQLISGEKLDFFR